MRHLLVLLLSLLQPCLPQDVDSSGIITTIHPRQPSPASIDAQNFSGSTNSKGNPKNVSEHYRGPQMMRFGESSLVEKTKSSEIFDSLKQGDANANKLAGRKKRFVEASPSDYEYDVNGAYGSARGNDSNLEAMLEDILAEKRAPKALMNSHIMHFGKKNSDVSYSPQIMRFGKKFSQLSVPPILRFGKRAPTKAFDFLNTDLNAHEQKYWVDCLAYLGMKDEAEIPGAVSEAEVESMPTGEGDDQSVVLTENEPSSDIEDLQHRRCKKILEAIRDNISSDLFQYNGISFPNKKNMAFSNPQMMRFGKKAANGPYSFSNPEMLHFGKRGVKTFSSPQMMRFGKKSSMGNPQILHFGKKSDHSFGSPQMLHFGKKSLKQFNNPDIMRFGKKASIKSPQMMHFGKKSLDQFSSPDIMRFDKRGSLSSPQMMHFGKKSLEQFNNPDIMRFGKKADFSSPQMMHFGKRELDKFVNPNIMRFGKRFESPQMMHFGKRDLNQFHNPNIMRFGKRYPGFFLPPDSSSSADGISKSSELDEVYLEGPQDFDDDSLASKSPFESKRGTTTARFGERYPLAGREMMHFGKRTLDTFKNPNIMRFGKRYSLAGPQMMHFGKRFMETPENPSLVEMGKKDSTSLENISLHDKRSLSTFNNPNIMRFGRSVSFKNTDVSGILANKSFDSLDNILSESQEYGGESASLENLELDESRLGFPRSKRHAKVSGTLSLPGPATASKKNHTTKQENNHQRRKREAESDEQLDDDDEEEGQGGSYATEQQQQQKRWGLLKPRQLFPMYEPQEFLVPQALMVANLHRPSRSLPWRQRWARSRPMFLHFG